MLVAFVGLDVDLISAALALSDGFNYPFHHLPHYPTLARLAALFMSFRVIMACVAMISVIYLTITLTAGDAINMGAEDEKNLIARIATMYLVVAAVNLATGLERSRWRQSVERSATSLMTATSGWCFSRKRNSP